MTADLSHDPWATLDDILGVEVATPVDQGIGPIALRSLFDRGQSGPGNLARVAVEQRPEIRGATRRHGGC